MSSKTKKIFKKICFLSVWIFLCLILRKRTISVFSIKDCSQIYHCQARIYFKFLSGLHSFCLRIMKSLFTSQVRLEGSHFPPPHCSPATVSAVRLPTSLTVCVSGRPLSMSTVRTRKPIHARIYTATQIASPSLWVCVFSFSVGESQSEDLSDAAFFIVAVRIK